MRTGIVVALTLSLAASLAVGKEPMPRPATAALIQGSQTPDQIPDPAAWRIFLGAKAEAISAAGHSKGFTSYLSFLAGLQQNDVSIFRSVLEDYGVRATNLMNNYNGEVESVSEALIPTYQNNLQASLAQLVQEERNTLQSQMTATGYGWLSSFVQGEKQRMTISSSDFSLVTSEINPHPRVVVASMKMPMPQGTQMGFSYSSYGSMWISISGRDSNDNPSGTFYVQLGTEGTTNPCAGQCPGATHTPAVEYYHLGTAYPQTGNGGPPYGYINWYYTWSFPFSPTNFQWNAESNYAKIICSISGSHYLSTPFPTGTGGAMQVEFATSYTSLPSGWYTCPTEPTCGPTWQPLTLQCNNNPGPPDFVPTSAYLYADYGENVIEIQQVAPCDRPNSSSKWSCFGPGVDAWTTGFPNPFPTPPGPAQKRLCTQHP